jgi:hypothetical protein
VVFGEGIGRTTEIFEKKVKRRNGSVIINAKRQETPQVLTASDLLVSRLKVHGLWALSPALLKEALVFQNSHLPPITSHPPTIAQQNYDPPPQHYKFPTPKQKPPISPKAHQLTMIVYLN